MSEDVSNWTKISITVVLCASLVSVAASMTMLGLGTFNDFRDSYIDSTNTSEASIIADLATKKSVESPTIYKCVLGLDIVSGYNIDHFEPTTSTVAIPAEWDKLENSQKELKALISPYNAARRFKVDYKVLSNGTFWLYLTEVSR